MPFTISPTEAQAIQEDEAQLLSAIAQIAQRIPGLLQLNNNTSPQPSDSLRIQMGRRLIYGQLADGPFRHELDANSLKVITDALQRPVTPEADPEKYVRKIPAIEIFYGDILLFREERDGTVTTNEIYFQVEQVDQQGQSDSLVPEPRAFALPAEAPRKEADLSTSVGPSPNDIALDRSTVDRADQLLVTAQYLLNPLRQPAGIYDQVSIHGYHIHKQGQEITISQGDRMILNAQNGELVSHHVSEQDWATLSQIEIPERFPKPVLNDLPKSVANENLQPPVQPQDKSEIQAEEVISIEASTVQTAEVVIDATSEESAIAVLTRAAESLPVSTTKQLLQATVQGWRQQVSQRFSNRLQQGTSWLATQQTALQNQRLAHAVHRLFQRGYERTGEHSYHARGCTIKRRGQNLYVLKDAVGELMKFKTSKVMGLGQRMTVLSVSDRLTHHQRQNLLDYQLDATAMPQGSLDVEAAYAAKTQKVEQTVRQFLTNFAHAHTWNRENGHFKLEIAEGDVLRITDKQDGRGVVFERNKGEVSSKLTGQDFAHFERLSDKMQNMTARQGQPGTHQPAKNQPTTNPPTITQPTTNGFKKTSAIEMD